MKTKLYKPQNLSFRLFIAPLHSFLWLFRGDKRCLDNLALESLITVTQVILSLLTIQTIYVAFSSISIASHGFAIFPIYEGVDPARLLPVGILSNICEAGTPCHPVKQFLPHIPLIGSLFSLEGIPLAGSIWESTATTMAFTFAYIGAGIWSHLQGFLTRPQTSAQLKALVEGTRTLTKVKATPDTLPIHRYAVRRYNGQGSGLVLLLRFGWLLSFILEALGVIAILPSGFSAVSLAVLFWALIQAAGFELVENIRLRLLDTQNQ